MKFSHDQEVPLVHDHSESRSSSPVCSQESHHLLSDVSYTARNEFVENLESVNVIK